MKTATICALLLVGLTILVACAGNQSNSPESTPSPEPTPFEVIFPDPEPDSSPEPELEPNPEEITTESMGEGEELIEFILQAENVFRDIVLGDLFNGYWDAELEDWVWSEYVEEAPDLWIETPEGPYSGWNMPRWRILPSSGFTSVADLNAAVHEYWSDDFEVSTDIHNESIDYAEIDGALYFFPAQASGIGDSFLGVIWELTRIEVLHQTEENARVRADAFITSYGDLYHNTIQWEIINGKIVTRDIDWGEHILWREAPEAIDAMITSGRWTEEYVADNWESGWFEQQVAW